MRLRHLNGVRVMTPTSSQQELGLWVTISVMRAYLLDMANNWVNNDDDDGGVGKGRKDIVIKQHEMPI